MQAAQLIIFAQSRPFEPFRVFMADGRELDVVHPELVMVAEYGLGLWFFHRGGHVEVLSGELVTGLKTFDAVNPDNFIGTLNSEG